MFDVVIFNKNNNISKYYYYYYYSVSVSFQGFANTGLGNPNL